MKQAQACSLALTTDDAQADLKESAEQLLRMLQERPKVKLEKPLEEEETDF